MPILEARLVEEDELAAAAPYDRLPEIAAVPFDPEPYLKEEIERRRVILSSNFCLLLVILVLGLRLAWDELALRILVPALERERSRHDEPPNAVADPGTEPEAYDVDVVKSTRNPGFG